MSNSSIWPIDSSLPGATTLGQSRPGSDGNEGVLCIPPKLQHCWSLSIRLFSIMSKTLVVRVLPLCREAVSVQWKENFVFWFGVQFNSTLNFTQSGWPILFIPGLLFPGNRLVKLPNPLSLAGERRPVQTSHWPFFNNILFRWTTPPSADVSQWL